VGVATVNPVGARGGTLSSLAAAATAVFWAASVLAYWNFTQMAGRSAGHYRDDPMRTAEFLALSFAIYAALITSGVVIVALVRRLLLRRKEAVRDRAAASHAGAAAASAAALFTFAILASRDQRLGFRAAGMLLDASVAAGVAVAAGGTCFRLMIRVRRSPVTAGLVRLGLSGLAVFQIAWMCWVALRERIDSGSWDAGGLLLPGFLIAVCLFFVSGAGDRLRYRIGSLRSSGGSLAARRGAGSAPALLAVVLLGIVLAAGRPPGAIRAEEPPRPTRVPNIVMIVADTLRADRLGVYGASRARTPNLDALAGRGVRIEQVYAAASWTLPATASLLTALNTTSHGLMTHRDHMREDAVSLVSVLKHAGYDTAGFVANGLISSQYGFDPGFDVLERTPGRLLDRHGDTPMYRTLTSLGLWAPLERFPRAEEVIERAFSWLDARSGAPFFMYLHLMDPHDPYFPPGPFDTMSTAAAVGGAGSAPLTMRIGTLASIMEGGRPVGRADLDRLTALYAGAVTYMDAQIGRLLQDLGRRDPTRGTLVVFTSDHGEEFAEHGDLGHIHTLHEELVRIPLIIAGPGVEGGRVLEGPARQVDVAPTILEAAGLSFPTPVEGASFWGAASRGEPLAPRDVFIEHGYTNNVRNSWHRYRSLRQGRLKLIGSTFHLRGQGPWKWELYDLAEDPGEKRDVASERASEAAALRERLEAWARRPRAGVSGETPLDEELLQRLRALGYVK